MLNWTKLHWHHLKPNTSTLLLSMLPSHTRPTKIDISAHLKSLTHLFILRKKRELVMPAIMLPSSCTQRDSKISPLFTDLEISSEFTEPLLDFTMVKDNSMPTFSTTVHGLSSQLIRNHHSKKSVDKTFKAISFHSVTQVNTSPLRRVKLPPFKTLESGLNNISHNTTLSQTICLYHSTRLKHKREISTLLPRFSKFSSLTNTPMNLSLRMLQVKFSTLLPLSSNSHIWELARLSESDQLLMMKLPSKRRFSYSNTTLTFLPLSATPRSLRTWRQRSLTTRLLKRLL